eukprot:XP_011668327.1 PREDICTED: calcium-activated chloride channel regulator 1-like [Strongylocentrotus purpuratus]
MEYQKRILLLLLLKIFLVGVVTSQKNIINLENGAYSNILIAINKNVPENLTIIENLKTMFTSASQRLYNATKQHVYWGHIKILVPNTWSIQSQYQFARTENSQSANILVHSRTDDEPVVENFVGCGTEGTLMHLTPSYILDMQYREKMFGNTDSVLVRNWGYYRWGLFKEHYDGDKRTDPTYPSDGGTEGTRCSLKIKGNIEMPDGTTCQFNDNQSGDNSKCRFVPDTIGQTATASLLFGTRDPHTQSVNSVLESRHVHNSCYCFNFHHKAYNNELRYSTNFNDVRNNFSTSHEVTQNQLVSGNLSFISPAGVIETVTISLPERGQDIVYYFAIRAWDEAGNRGDLSNIASLSIRFIPVFVPTTEPLPVSVPSTTEPLPTSVPTTIEPIPVSVTTVKPTGPDNLALIIGLCCAVGVVIIVGAVILCVYFYRKKHTGEMKFGSASGLAGLPDVEGMHQNPTYDYPTYSTN